MTPGRVVTFYSYKGGVGRTFALANVAVLLARWGWRVLAVDFDLEAPGLSHYFRNLLPTAHGDGLVELVTAELAGQGVDWRKLVQRVDLGTGIEGTPVLDLLRAGREGEEYRRKLDLLNWRVAYEQQDLGRTIERWRAQWVEAYDLVVVDSRTGLSDTQGICTEQLPDLLVALFTCNEQSLDGVLAEVRRSQRGRAARQGLDRYDLQHLPVVPVVTRLDPADTEQFARWRSVLGTRLAPLFEQWPEAAPPTDLLQHLQLPHRAALTYGEGLVVLRGEGQHAGSLAFELATLAAVVARNAEDSRLLVADRDRYLLAARPGGEPGLRVYLSLPARGHRELDLRMERMEAFRAVDEPEPVASYEVLVERLQGVEGVGHVAGGTRQDPRGALGVLGAADVVVMLIEGRPSRWQRLDLSLLFALPGTRLVVLQDGTPDDEFPDHTEFLPWSDDPLPAILAALGLAPPAPPPADPLAAWKAHLHARHARLVPFFPGADQAVLADVFVELDLDLERDPRVKVERSVGPLSLDGLLLAEPRAVVLGEPGAGKTTLLRHLAWRLSGQAQGPMPIYLALSRYPEGLPDPFAAAEAELLAAGVPVPGLAAALAVAPEVWVLLDGLDEVPGNRVETLREDIVRFAGRQPNARLLVASRPVVEGTGGLPAGFARAMVRGLASDRQALLLTRLLGPDRASPVIDEVRRRPALAELARNPLMLTLIAVLAREAEATRTGLPTRRGRLYAMAVDLLLRRGFAVQPTGVRDPTAARRVLRRLSMDLQEAGGECWSAEDLEERLREPWRDPELGPLLRDAWESPHRLLLDLGQNSGVLGPHDGAGAPWRYLHRSLREFLAAERLVAQGPAAIAAWVEAWTQAAQSEDGPDPARWGEVHALLVGIVDQPRDLLDALHRVDAGLARRALPAADLEPEVALGILLSWEDWHESDVEALVAAHGPALAPALWGRVHKEASIRELAITWWALELAGQPLEREAFFGKAEKGLGQYPDSVEVPAGEFWMGSPEGVGGADEHPRHRVRITQEFKMGRTPVTAAQWGTLAGPTKSGDVPVTRVTWYEARLYCAWVGGRLPTEAEWEYACRAGTDTAYWFGDDPADLPSYGWFDANAKGPKRVGQKSPNPWGLHDLHGNVWEWCEDGGRRDYLDRLEVDPILPPAPGGRRVFRGGSWDYGAGTCRSACRGHRYPGNRGVSQGFRVVLPLPRGA